MNNTNDITKLSDAFDKRGALRASWLAAKTITTKGSKALGVGAAVFFDGTASAIIATAPEVAKDLDNTIRATAHQLHNAAREYAKFVGYDNSISLEENNKLADEKAELKEEIKEMKRLIKGKKSKKTIDDLRAEHARLKNVLASQNPPKPNP